MKNIMHKIGKISSFLTKYIGVIIIAFSVLAFFWRDGFAWTTKYTSVFLGVAMFGMGLTIRMEDFKVVFSRPKEVLIGFVSQYTIMPLIAWTLCMILKLPTELALGVILVGCCPGGTASNVITYIAGGDVALSVGMTIASTLIAPLMTPLLVYILAGTWVEVSFWAMVISVVKVIMIPVLLGILIRTLFGKQIEKNFRSAAADLRCIDRDDHFRNCSHQCRKNCKLRCACTDCCGDPQSVRYGTWPSGSKNISY